MSLLPVLLALAGPALAQESIVQTEGTECAENAVPIAGTSGFENTRHALRTTTQTYSAASYAEKHLFPTSPRTARAGRSRPSSSR